MKKILVPIFIVLLISSVYAVPISQSSGWLGREPELRVGEKVKLVDKEVTLVNTGGDASGNYVIIQVGENREKIYERETRKIDGIEIYVDSISDEVSSRYDSAVIYMAYKRDGRPEGIYKGNNIYEIKEEGSIKLSTGNELIIKDIMQSEVIITLDGLDYQFLLGELKQIDRLNIQLTNILYNSRTGKGSAIVKIYVEPVKTIVQKTPKKEISKTVPLVEEEQKEEQVKESESIQETEEPIKLNLDKIILDFLKKLISKFQQ